jgi:hypothetical protein
MLFRNRKVVIVLNRSFYASKLLISIKKLNMVTSINKSMNVYKKFYFVRFVFTLPHIQAEYGMTINI